MKVAIFGASGIVGRSLRSLFTELQIDWIGTYATHKFQGGLHLDVRDTSRVIDFFSNNTFTHCINCVAERNVDTCEKHLESTLTVNAEFAKTLAEQCSQKKIYMIHISTDYVFDGTNSPYFPTSLCSPIQAYGTSKYLAETYIQRANPESCIVRVPVLYTDHYMSLNETVVTAIAKKVLNKSKTQSEDDYYLRSPVFIEDLCHFLKDCSIKRKKGVFHFYTSKNTLTKYQLAKEIGEYLDTPTSHILPQVTNTHSAGRPYDTSLLDLQYDRNEYPDTSIKEGLARCLKKFKHPRLSQESNPKQSIFYMIDLDGTLVDTEKLHYDAYTKAFNEYNLEFCSWHDYSLLLSVETYCKEKAGSLYNEIKLRKQAILCEKETICFTQGAEDLLLWLLRTNQNFVIVTNTSKKTVEFFKTKLPLLQEVNQWITREDVEFPKPNSQPYTRAVERYFKNEDYKLGIENTISGYYSLKDITSVIYMVGDHESIARYSEKEDFYWIQTLTDIFWK